MFVELHGSRTRGSKVLMFTNSVYWSNAIHWIDKVGFIVSFDLDQEMIYEIKAPFPRRLDLKYKNYLRYIFESGDQLLLVELCCPLITKFRIYELKRDYSDWLVKYHVDLEEFGGSLFPEFSLKMLPFRYDHLLSPVLGSDNAESFLVVEISGKITGLNLESKTYHELCNITSYNLEKLHRGVYLWPNVHQFAAPLYNLQYVELNEYQYNMGLLLIKKKEPVSENKELDQALALAKTMEFVKREKTTHLIEITEVEKREEKLRKNLGVEKQCVHELEKALRKMRLAYAEIKFTSDAKLAEVSRKTSEIQSKSNEIGANDSDRVSKQKKLDLEETQKRIDIANSDLKIEEEISSRIENLALKENEAAATRKILEVKEKELIELVEKLNVREQVEVQNLLDEHKVILDAKTHDFEVELEQKIKSPDETQSQEKLVDVRDEIPESILSKEDEPAKVVSDSSYDVQRQVDQSLASDDDNSQTHGSEEASQQPDGNEGQSKPTRARATKATSQNNASENANNNNNNNNNGVAVHFGGRKRGRKRASEKEPEYSEQSGRGYRNTKQKVTKDLCPPKNGAAEKVGSSEDLVTEILLRLPVRSLIVCKSVSKLWYSMISSFKNPKPAADPPSGLFVPTLSGYVFVPFDIHNPVKFPTLNHISPLAPVNFKHSCNGLMLCGKLELSAADFKIVTDENYIFNPTLNQIIRLPVPSNGKGSLVGMSIAFDPLKSPHYKVIYVFDTRDYVSATKNYQIHIYSSQTRTCKLSYYLPGTRDSMIMFTNGVYWNNAIHWIDKVGFIVYFDLDQEMTYEIKAPFASRDLCSLFEYDFENDLWYIFESRDKLLLVDLCCPVITKFKIYELKRDYSDWLLKYHVDLEEFGRSLFPEISLNMHPFRYDNLLSLVLGSDDDAESFLVVELSGKITRLNLESKTSHELCDVTSYNLLKLYAGVYRWPNVFPFAASLYNLQYDEVVDIGCGRSMKLPWKTVM